MNERGAHFFEETLRIGRIFDLANADKIRAAFEREVTTDTEQQIEATVQELIDWLIDPTCGPGRRSTSTSAGGSSPSTTAR